MFGTCQTPSTRLKKWKYLCYSHMKSWIIWQSLTCSVGRFLLLHQIVHFTFHIFGTTSDCLFVGMELDKEKDKIKVTETETSKFWSHFKSFIGPHQAIDEHEQNPNNSWHQPVGVSGDDARYTLAGRKIIIMMISSVLQEVKSVLPILCVLRGT